MNNYKHKYQKYKAKYFLFKQKQLGGSVNLNELLVLKNPTNVRDYGDGNLNVKKHLLLGEILNFEGANKRDYELMGQIYHKNALMRMANEKGIKGFEKNMEQMVQMYNIVPDLKVIRHDVQFGSGQWTAVEQIMRGTYTHKINESADCKPNNKEVEMRACSLIRWENNKIVEENIFWDNYYFMVQMDDPTGKCVDLSESTTKYSLNDKLGFISFGRGDESDEFVRKRLVLFENFNFNGYNKRNWDLIYDLYDENAVIIFQSGVKIKGIKEILKQMTNEINDDKVVSIPIHFGSGNWTAASLLMTGSLKTNGEQWTMEHLALIKWNGMKIVEAHAYWDNNEFRKQTGIILDL